MSTTLTPILPANIDSTMISAFRSCPRKFFNEFVLGLRPPGISVDLHAGGCFALALETVRKQVFLNGKELTHAMRHAEAAFHVAWGDFEIPEFKKTAKTRERMWEAVVDYFDHYPPLTDHIQPYVSNGKPTIEFTFAIPLEPAMAYIELDGMSPHQVKAWPKHPVSGEPYIYSGRIDMLGHDVQSGIAIAEDDKTQSTGFSANWSEKWDLRSQFIGYTWVLQQMGIPCEHVAVRGVGILKTLFHHAEIIKPYSDYLRAQWLEQLRRDLWRITAMWNEGYWDYNMADSCNDFNNCIFLQACQSSTPEAWLKNFAVRRWNPLTVDPIKGT